MSFAKKLQNLRPSWRAVIRQWHEEFSFRIQVFLCAGILLISYVLHVSAIELMILILAMGAVLAFESLNTALEELCDHVTPQHHPRIGKIKDLGSGASLLIGIAATSVCLLIFTPRIISL